MTNVSIVIPIAPYHIDVSSEAIASAQSQTIPCTVIPVYDAESKGAGTARNAGLTQVTTPFVVFLDADDLLAPTFVEECLKIWQPNHYVYTDVLFDGTAAEMPDCAWVGGKWHVNTTLQSTEWVRAVGGYDEYLPGAEDTDYFFRLTRAGCCGLHLKQPLFTYRKLGQRAESFILGEHHLKVLEGIREHYKGFPMGCCGDTPIVELPPQGQAAAGFMLVRPAWQGNRVVVGRATGRRYPEAGKGISARDTIWVHHTDIEAMPGTWRVSPPSPPASGQGQGVAPRFNDIASLGARLFGQPVPQAAPPATPPTAPDVQRILSMARELWRE